MPLYRFQAVDAAGQPSGGTLDAPSPGHVAQTLAGRGLRVKSVSPVDQQVMATPSVAAPIQTAPPQVRRQVARAIEQPASVQMQTVAQARPKEIFQTGRAKNSELSFLFYQIGNMWRAGIPPTQALTQLAAQERNPAIKQALQHMAVVTSERGSLAEAMSAFPDVFPEGAVGAIAAGEAGGYIPEAANDLGERFRAAHKMGWAARISRWAMFYVGFVGLPFVMALTTGMMKLVDTAINGTEQVTPFVLFMTFLKTAAIKFFTSWPLFVLLAGIAIYGGVGWWMRQTKQRQLRHKLGYKIPVFGHFAKQENLAVFGSHLERLSAAGISARQSWELASRAVPNNEFADVLGKALHGTAHETPFSDIALRSGIVPPDQANMIRTGEMTGSLPDAFRHMSAMAGYNAQTWHKWQLYSLWLIAFIICMIGGTIGAATFWAGYYNQMIHSALDQ